VRYILSCLAISTLLERSQTTNTTLPAMSEKSSLLQVEAPSQLPRIRWFNFSILVLIPAVGLLSTIWIPLQRKTLLLSILYYLLTLGSITAGKHLSTPIALVVLTPLRLSSSLGPQIIQSFHATQAHPRPLGSRSDPRQYQILDARTPSASSIYRH
jgi:hypothetical protein